jgi:hypothetical protein
MSRTENGWGSAAAQRTVAASEHVSRDEIVRPRADMSVLQERAILSQGGAEIVGVGE